ncbi:uncharacterized protein LOC120343893 [Styela clava]
MNFVKIILFVSLVCGLVAELKVPNGSCVSKIVDGKFHQVGDCKKDDGSEIARLIKKSLEEKKKAEIKCDFNYKTKCFRIVVYDTRNVTFNDGKSICKSINNGNPANIYDIVHYKSLRTYLRSMMTAGWSYIQIWTGMEYKDNQLLLSSGEPITLATEVWYTGYPKPDVSWAKVGVDVNKDSEFAPQGMFNEQPLQPRHGVICEM